MSHTQSEMLAVGLVSFPLVNVIKTDIKDQIILYRIRASGKWGNSSGAFLPGEGGCGGPPQKPCGAGGSRAVLWGPGFKLRPAPVLPSGEGGLLAAGRERAGPLPLFSSPSQAQVGHGWEEDYGVDLQRREELSRWPREVRRKVRAKHGA